MYLRDKVWLHEITKRTGLSRNTLRRWLRTPEEVQVPATQPAGGIQQA
jgi:transposase-like protein